MFEINNEFLAGAGYDVAGLSEERKAQYIKEFSAEFTERLQERIAGELDEEQVKDWDRMQSSVDNARAWLDEFHWGYHDREDFKQVIPLLDSEDEAVLFYSSALWLRDAVPSYHDLMQEELNAYHQDLVEKRRKANELLTGIG